MPALGAEAAEKLNVPIQAWRLTLRAAGGCNRLGAAKLPGPTTAGIRFGLRSGTRTSLRVRARPCHHQPDASRLLHLIEHEGIADDGRAHRHRFPASSWIMQVLDDEGLAERHASCGLSGQESGRERQLIEGEFGPLVAETTFYRGQTVLDGRVVVAGARQRTVAHGPGSQSGSLTSPEPGCVSVDGSTSRARRDRIHVADL
jgi:hypothetical protein